MHRTLFFDIISSKFNTLGPTFLQVPDSFPEVVFFKALEIVVDRLNGFFIVHKFFYRKKVFGFRNRWKSKGARPGE